MCRRSLFWFGCLCAGAAVLLGLGGLADPQPAPVQPRPAAVASPDQQPRPDQDAHEAELDQRFQEVIGPLLKKHCHECHAADGIKGEMGMERIVDVRSAQSSGVDLRLLREMLSTGEMPPDTRPGPTEHERLLAAQWLDAVIAYVPPDAPIDPGWMTPHRLNRTEYRLTLRDLLGIDPRRIDLSQRLPRDDTGYGFDNIADVLTTSPLAVEEYLAAAEKAVELALGPEVEIGDNPKPLKALKGDNGQPLPRGGVFLYSAGAARGEYVAPVEGQYIIRVRAWETPAGDERARLGLRVDGEQITWFEVAAQRDEPGEYTVSVRLKAGERRISAHFLNDYYVRDKADRNLGIERISVAGPVDEASVVRPWAWSMVFAPAAGANGDEAQARAVLGAFAARAYRRPATDEDVDALLRVYRAEREGGATHERAVRTGLTAALVSPRFLFRTIRHPDPASPGVRYRLDAYELASRLSYFLWSSMPDEELFAAAADGSLLTDEGLSAQTRRMLKDPRSAALVENFAGQWLQLRNLDAIAIDRASYPDYDEQLREAMRREAEFFFGDLLAMDGSVLALISSDYTFVNERLARHYGIEGVTGNEFRRITLDAGSARGGVLTMGAVLTITSNPSRTSPVKRGLFVLDQILGTPPPPPPADIPPLEQAPGTGPEPSVREQLAAHTTMPGCAACHNRLDPIGLSFENFDAIGRWRESENGRPIDATGVLPGGVALSGVNDLKRVLSDRSDQFVETLTAKMLTYALGRGVEPFDRPAIRHIAVRTRANGDRLTALIESIVLSETFRTARGKELRR